MMRRRIPSRPTAIWPRLITMKAGNISQKWTFPAVSFILRPVAFGNQ